MNKTSTHLIYILPLLSLVTLCGCKPPKNKFTNPRGYDLEQADKFNMPESLLEISGVALHNGNPDTIYSIQDEDGKLFRQKWDIKKQHNTHFASKGDYEDLAILKDQVLVLKSNGSVYVFPVSESSKEETKAVKEFKKIVPKGEYESLYADPETNQVYILCKACPSDKKAKKVSGYVFDFQFSADSAGNNIQLNPAGEFTVDLNPIKELNPKLKASLNPSALSKNLLTKQWYILSSVNKLLLVADAQWNIKEVHRLNSSTFNQPEGLAFDNQHNMYISNEGDELTNGNILKFKYHPGKDMASETVQ
ncbi:SdiA-regulated domain-containing protein [Pedobacter sp. BAL39]|uniref:SdiA-regulated domain-containing protein n=1 Tax=Pedobacter sp. BAL39 TaxID=391596 RepID=UPI000586C55A|nr:SdiA-regulated domain-containing protein [Pedobacter sp. BAL39]